MKQRQEVTSPLLSAEKPPSRKHNPRRVHVSHTSQDFLECANPHSNLPTPKTDSQTTYSRVAPPHSPSTTMATSHQPTFSRPYTSGLGRASNTPFTGQTPYAAPPQNPSGAGASGPTPQQREAQRLERERLERQERERREAEERNALEALSEEQREEINEAVRLS